MKIGLNLCLQNNKSLQGDQERCEPVLQSLSKALSTRIRFRSKTQFFSLFSKIFLCTQVCLYAQRLAVASFVLFFTVHSHFWCIGKRVFNKVFVVFIHDTLYIFVTENLLMWTRLYSRKSF